MRLEQLEKAVRMAFVGNSLRPATATTGAEGDLAVHLTGEFALAAKTLGRRPLHRNPKESGLRASEGPWI